MSVRLGQIVEAMREHGGVLHGDAARMIARLAPIDSATPDSITFLSDPKLSAALEFEPGSFGKALGVFFRIQLPCFFKIMRSMRHTPRRRRSGIGHVLERFCFRGG